MGIVDVSGGVKVLDQWKVPHYRFPESAARALAGTVRYAAWVKRPRTQYKTFKVDRSTAKLIFYSERSVRALFLS